MRVVVVHWKSQLEAAPTLQPPLLDHSCTAAPVGDCSSISVSWLHACARPVRTSFIGRPPRVKPRLLLGLRDTTQRTALLCACCVSDTAAAASVLLENGADVDAEDGHAVRPLHLAAMQGDVELLKALLPHKPDLDAKDGQGRSVPAFSISAIDFFHLLAAGLSPKCYQDQSLGDGFRTALLCATMEGHGEAVEALLDAGADAAVQVTHSLPSFKKPAGAFRAK